MGKSVITKRARPDVLSRPTALEAMIRSRPPPKHSARPLELDEVERSRAWPEGLKGTVGQHHQVGQSDTTDDGEAWQLTPSTDQRTGVRSAFYSAAHAGRD